MAIAERKEVTLNSSKTRMNPECELKPAVPVGQHKENELLEFHLKMHTRDPFFFLNSTHIKICYFLLA